MLCGSCLIGAALILRTGAFPIRIVRLNTYNSDIGREAKVTADEGKPTTPDPMRRFFGDRKSQKEEQRLQKRDFGHAFRGDMANLRYTPSLERRDQVSILVAGGLPEEAIAQLLEISRPTLRKYYREEILTARARRKAEIILAMYHAAISGNVSAQKAWLRLAD